MKSIYLITISVIFSFLAMGQSLQELNHRISELESQKIELKSKLKQINSELESLNKTKLLLIKRATSARPKSKNDDFKIYSYIRISNTPIFESPSFMAKVLYRLRERVSVAVIGYKKMYWKIKYKKFIGYIPEASVEKLEPMNALKDVHGHIELLPERLSKGEVTSELMSKIRKMDKEEEIRDNLKAEVEIQKIRKNISKSRILRDKKRKEMLTEKFGAYNAQRILSGEIWLGMSTSMARESQGNPTHINRTVTVNIVREQWVYDSKYLYFQNGILTSWQD